MCVRINDESLPVDGSCLQPRYINDDLRRFGFGCLIGSRHKIKGMAKTDLEKEVDRHLLEARAPHYKFVQFLTVLCAGMLALSVQQGNNYDWLNPCLGLLLSLLPLLLLALSVVAGAVALRGETELHLDRVREIEQAVEKHNGNEILIRKAIRRDSVLQPPRIYRTAYPIQCTLSVLAVLLLILSKGVILVHGSKSIHPGNGQNIPAVALPATALPTNSAKQ